MVPDPALYELAQAAGRQLLVAGRRLVTAESCTAGWIAKAVTDVAGSSAWFDGGYVCYSNVAKMRDLGVAAELLEVHGAVSEQVVRAMAEGALRRAGWTLRSPRAGSPGQTAGCPPSPSARSGLGDRSVAAPASKPWRASGTLSGTVKPFAARRCNMPCS